MRDRANGLSQQLHGNQGATASIARPPIGVVLIAKHREAKKVAHQVGDLLSATAGGAEVLGVLGASLGYAISNIATKKLVPVQDTIAILFWMNAMQAVMALIGTVMDPLVMVTLLLETIVGPTKLPPRLLRSLAIASASGDCAGTSRIDFRACWIGLPPTKLHKCRAKPPRSARSR